MKILVTGANGYIGTRVCTFLMKNDVDVIACDLFNNNLDAKIKFFKLNIFENDVEDFYEFFGKPDVCLHLARRDGFVHMSDKHMLDLSSHYKFLENLLRHGLKNLAIMGTMHEVGYWEGAIDENTPCKPTNFYGISKNSLREASKLLCQKYNAVWKWLRAYYIYGNDTIGNSVFNKLSKAVREGAKEFNLTTGENKFDFINVDDLAELISYSIMQNNINGIINVSTGTPISFKDMIIKYVDTNHLNIKLNRGVYPERESESPCIYGDNNKIKEIIKIKRVKR